MNMFKILPLIKRLEFRITFLSFFSSSILSILQSFHLSISVSVFECYPCFNLSLVVDLGPEAILWPSTLYVFKKFSCSVWRSKARDLKLCTYTFGYVHRCYARVRFLYDMSLTFKWPWEVDWEWICPLVHISDVLKPNKEYTSKWNCVMKLKQYGYICYIPNVLSSERLYTQSL